jgi:hypothetical protein
VDVTLLRVVVVMLCALQRMDTDLLALLLSASFLEDIQIRAILYQACAEGHHDTSAVHVMPMEQVYPCIHVTSSSSIFIVSCFCAVHTPHLSLIEFVAPFRLSVKWKQFRPVVVHIEGITQFTACCCSSVGALLWHISRADAVWVAVPALVQHHAP